MNKIAVVYWSGTGNTEMMAKAVAEGAAANGCRTGKHSAVNWALPLLLNL